MSQVLVTLSLWLHAVSTIVFVGYFVLLVLIYLPALRDGPEESFGATVTLISRHSRRWLYVSILVFAVTGAYLTLVDPDYRGLGNFSSPWAMLMLVKHTIILIMVGLGFWFNAIWRVGPQASTNLGGPQALIRFRLYAVWMAICGVVVLLLTAIAQVQ